MILLTADMHIRADVPKCRTDDFLTAQWDKLHQIDKLIKKHDVEYWLDAGDIFEKAKPSLELVVSTLQHWPRIHCFTVAGNHDLPSHNYGRLGESALAVMLEAGKAVLLDQERPIIVRKDFDIYVYGASYKMPLPTPTKPRNKRVKNVLILHDMIYPTRRDALPNAPGNIASALLRRLDFDLIVSGHNHSQFDCKYEDKLLVNVGCVSRQTADTADFKPRIALYNPAENTVKYIHLQIQNGVVSRDHLDRQQAKDDQVSAFVEMLKTDTNNAKLSFTGNVNDVLEQTQADKRTRDKVWEAINEPRKV